jgi:hypothetical protein
LLQTMVRTLVLLTFTAIVSAELSARFYNNAMLLGEEQCKITQPTTLNITAPSQLPCPGMKWGLLSVRYDGMFIGGEIGQDYEFAVKSNGRTRFWIHAWKMVDVWTSTRPNSLQQYTGIWNFTKTAGVNYPVRLEFQVELQEMNSAVVQLLWRKTGDKQFLPLPASALSATILPTEAKRQSMQAGLATGWNTWHRASAMAHVHLPSGFGFQMELADTHTNQKTSWNAVDKCLMEEDCKIRPGRHTLNGSFTEITGRLRGKTAPEPVNVTISSVHLDASGNAVVILLQANNSKVSTDLSVSASPSFYFDCGDACGNISTSGSSTAAAIRAQPAGFAPMTLIAVGGSPTIDTGNLSLTVAFTSGLACLVATPTGRPSKDLPTTIDECQQLVAQGRGKYDDELEKRYPRATSGGKRDVIEAMRSVMGWNTM